MNDRIKVEDLLDNQEYLKVAGVFALELEQLARMAFLSPDKAMKHFSETQALLGLEYLSDAVFCHIWQCKQSIAVREKDIQRHFFEHLSQYLPGASRLDLAMNRYHKPDGFVLLNDGFIAPVEVKLYDFTRSSRVQLKRYMNIYNAEKGVAVATNISCDLPSNMIFVQINKEDVGNE
jgi:hypothetical protein